LALDSIAVFRKWQSWGREQSYTWLALFPVSRCASAPKGDNPVTMETERFEANKWMQ